MKTKNLFKLFFVGGAAALAVLSCSTKEQAVKGYNVAEFAVDVTSTTATTATAKVTVANNDAAPWYAFATTDLESKAADLVAAELENLTVSTKILNTGSKDVTLSGLVPGGVHYRVIVTGLAPDGRSYGTPAEADFRSGADFSENAAWNVQYAGTAVEDGEQVNYFQISGTAEEDKFSYIVVPADSFAEMGVAEIVSADVEAILAADAAADATFSGDDYYTWDALDPGDYVFVMYGVEKPFNPTLQYALGEFTIEGPSDLYNAYLGNWYNEAGDLFVMEENVINQSFYFNGMPAYLTADGSIEIPFDTTEDGNYILGIGSDDDVWDGDPLAFGALDEEGNLVMQGGTVEYDGELINIVGIGIFSFDGRSFAEVNTILWLPATLTKTEPQATEEYAAWLGTWYTEGGDKIEISQKLINNSYNLTGLFEDYALEIPFDKENGTIDFFADIAGEDDDYYYVLAGYDQYDYVELGGDTGLLASAALEEDGESFVITGNVYDAVYSGQTWHEIIVEIGIWATPDLQRFGRPEGSIYLSLPATLYRTIPEPSEEYLAWIGDWEVNRGTGATAVTDTWSIAEKKVNSTYTVTGVEGTSFEVEGRFDKSTKAFSLKEQTLYEAADEEGNVLMTIDLMGTVLVGRQTYAIGDGATPFYAVLKEDGTVTVTANTYGGYQFNGFRLYGVMAESSNIVTYSSVGYSVPFTMTAVEEPVEGSSVTSLSFPVRPEQWTATDLQRLPGAKSIRANGADKSQAKAKGKVSKTLTKDKKDREFKGDLSKAGNKKVNFGGGKRGKLNK